MDKKSFNKVFEDYFLGEGWWRVYKNPRHYGQIKHNYDLKRRIRKRFGESKKQMFINNMLIMAKDTLIGSFMR